MTDDLKNPLDAFLESEDTELFSDEAFTPQSKQINEAPQLSKPVEQQTENQEELKDVPNAATDQQTLFAEAFAQTPSAQAGADAADPLEAALKKAQAQSENRMIERLAEKNAVFCYANAKEEITDRDVTFEALREKYQSDFPELSDAKKVSWTVTYGKTTKNVQNPGSDKVYDIKSEIERSKPFIDGIKNAKKDEEKQPVCTVKPKVTAQQKGEINLSSYKDYHIFVPLLSNTSTRIILKKPKTDSSIRKVWLPKTVAYILREWKKAQDELRDFLGDEYQDYNLVVALPNGRPCENRIIEKEFLNLKEKAGLPNVVFHSLRHSSTTYKLKLNHGDLKATQGDTGHAEIDMITKVYAHILDEDRKINAQKFESAFYANPDLRSVKPPQEEPQPAQIDLNALIEQLQKSPELANTLAALISAKPAC